MGMAPASPVHLAIPEGVAVKVRIATGKRCAVKVRLGTVGHHSLARRQKRSARLDFPVDECGDRQTHEADGVAMCARRAGEWALAVMLKTPDQ